VDELMIVTAAGALTSTCSERDAETTTCSSKFGFCSSAGAVVGWRLLIPLRERGSRAREHQDPCKQASNHLILSFCDTTGAKMIRMARKTYSLRGFNLFVASWLVQMI
jgi:hypothetical protein